MIKTGLCHLVLLALLSAFSMPSKADIALISEAVNKSGRQRMLTQRMLKTYTMIGLDVDPLSAREQLQQAIALFDQQLLELIRFSPAAPITAALAQVSKLWIDYRIALSKFPVRREKAMQLLQSSDVLLQACHQIVLMLVEYSGSSAAHLVNISGRQRMLSQRMSMLYMYQSWGFDDAHIQAQMNRDESDFDEALKEMLAAPVNSAEITRELRRARSEWVLFKRSLQGEENKPVPFLVNLAGDKLLKRMNHITSLYDKIEQQ